MQQPVTHIVPHSKWKFFDIKEIWKFRELLYIFAWRDLKVRYKQTILGAAWAIFQPVSQTFIFTIFFGQLAKIPSGDLPYSLFVLVGVVFWGLFSGIVGNGSNSLVENEGIIKKVYFPRIILPFSKVAVGLVDFLITFLLLIIVSLYLGYLPVALAMIVIPLGLLITVVSSGGLALLLSAINVKYRDVRFILPFFLQMLIFLTPVIYPTNIVRPSFRYLMALNPMTGVVESIRTVIAGSNDINWLILSISSLSAILIFFVGLYYFRLTEKYFADIV